MLKAYIIELIRENLVVLRKVQVRGSLPLEKRRYINSNLCLYEERRVDSTSELFLSKCSNKLEEHGDVMLHELVAQALPMRAVYHKIEFDLDGAKAGLV